MGLFGGRAAGLDAGSTGARRVRIGRNGGLIKERRLRRGPAVVSIRYEDSFFRVIELPSSLDGRELLSAAKLALEPALPFGVDEGALDLAKVPGADQDEGMVKYVVCGAGADAVGRRVAALRAMGVKPVAMEPEWATLWRVARELKPDGKACMVIDLGAGGSRTMVVGPSGEPVAWHRSSAGVGALLKELGSEPAERAGAPWPEVGAGEVTSTAPFAELAGDLARALFRARQEFPATEIEIWAVGGGAAWPVLLAALSEALGTGVRATGSQEAADRAPIVALDPRWVMAAELARWRLKGKSKDEQEEAAGFDLLRPEIAPRKARSAERIGVALLAVALLDVASVGAWQVVTAKAADLARQAAPWQKVAAKAGAATKSNSRAAGSLADIQSRLSLLASIPPGMRGSGDLLAELIRDLPPGGSLNSVALDAGGKLVVTGTVPAFGNVGAYAQALASSGRFSDVSVVSESGGGQATGGVRFQIGCLLREGSG